MFLEWQFSSAGEHFGADLFPKWQFPTRGEHFGRDFVPGGSIPAEGVFPAEGLSFVGRNKTVAGNLFFIPAVFFPYRGDELAGVVDPESHVCDR